MAVGRVQLDATPRGGRLTPSAVRELLDHQVFMLRLTSHELRRPLGVIEGYLEMIGDGSLGPPPTGAVHEALLEMASSAREMGVLIGGLAAVARLDDQVALSSRQEPCRLQLVVAAAVEAAELIGRRHQVSIAPNIPDIEVVIDPGSLRIALVNLLSNAVEHSPAGGTVRVTIAVDDEIIRIAVSDDGPGILPGDVEHIFDPWRQGSSASDGLGLGLWIVRRIVESHGGRVTVRSAPGQGATFAVALPRGRASTIGGPLA